MGEEEIENCLKLVKNCIDKIDEIDPIYSDGILIKGNYYSIIGAHQSALEVYLKFIGLKPDDYRGYFNFAN